MAGLDPAISIGSAQDLRAGITGTSPVMTKVEFLGPGSPFHSGRDDGGLLVGGSAFEAGLIARQACRPSGTASRRPCPHPAKLDGACHSTPGCSRMSPRRLPVSAS